MEEPEEPRYNGAFAGKDISAIDLKPRIDEACHSNCHAAWENLEKCEARIEKKGEGNCAGW